MDIETGRPDNIGDYLRSVHPNQWFSFRGREKIYANVELTTHYGIGGELIPNTRSLPTEQECIDGLAQLQTDFDGKDYARKRRGEYPTVEELVVALYDTDDKAAIDAKRAEVKAKYSKP